MSQRRMNSRSAAWSKTPGDTDHSSSNMSSVPPHLRGTAAIPSPPAPKPSSHYTPRGQNFRRTAQPSPSAKSICSVDDSKPFRCPFPGCDLCFATKALLIKHKADPGSGHDYCKVCDLDFEDDDAYHLHKMDSEKHITCHICSEDFRSEAGCNRHMSQMHATQQNIRCRGCSKLFLQGAALMSHIEKSQCPVIHKAEFETQRAMVALTMEHITKNGVQVDPEIHLDGIQPTLPNEFLAGGGVPLDGLSLVDHDEALDGSLSGSSFAEKWPALGSGPKVKAAFQPIPEDFPLLGSEPKGKEVVRPDMDETVDENEEQTWANRIFPDAAPTPAPPEWVTETQAVEFTYRSVINPINGQTSHFRLADIKRHPFTGMFHCPMNKCEAGPYPTLELLEAHLGSGVHKGVSNRCVGCLRIFKSPSALTAHMESSSERCRVRESRHFGNALNLVSGGYLGVNGRHADGSVKIDTPESPMPIVW